MRLEIVWDEGKCRERMGDTYGVGGRERKRVEV